MAKPSSIESAAMQQKSCMQEIHPEDIGELRIELDPSAGWAFFIGTRMQLEAEGVIPSDFDWPDGFRQYNWEADGLHFTLFRQRPPGAKGARRMFFDCDNWKLRMHRGGIHGYEPYNQREIRLRERELRAMRHRASPEGARELEARWSAVCRARADRDFSAFKALIPCLMPEPGKRRGRPPRKEVPHE